MNSEKDRVGLMTLELKKNAKMFKKIKLRLLTFFFLSFFSET